MPTFKILRFTPGFQTCIWHQVSKTSIWCLGSKRCTWHLVSKIAARCTPSGSGQKLCPPCASEGDTSTGGSYPRILPKSKLPTRSLFAKCCAWHMVLKYRIWRLISKRCIWRVKTKMFSYLCFRGSIVFNLFIYIFPAFINWFFVTFRWSEERRVITEAKLYSIHHLGVFIFINHSSFPHQILITSPRSCHYNYCTSHVLMIETK